MAKTFRPYERDQLRLMPPALADWVPEGHLARFVSDLVDDLDLTAIEDTYAEERGYPPYHPRMMVTVLLYAYCTGTYSSRKIAAPAGGQRGLPVPGGRESAGLPDDQRLPEAAQCGAGGPVHPGAALCRQAGLVRLGRVAIDGTRIKANASKHKAMSYGRMAEKDAALRRRSPSCCGARSRSIGTRMPSTAPDRRGDELPAELARRESRLQKIREAKAALEAEAREQAPQRREGSGPGHAGPEGPAELHRSRVEDPEDRRRLHPGLQRPGRGGCARRR